MVWVPDTTIEFKAVKPTPVAPIIIGGISIGIIALLAMFLKK